MKINREKINERLEGVEEKHRAFIYDASIILEFLSATFMPTRYFLADNYKVEPGLLVRDENFQSVYKEKSMMMRDVYELYRLFREQKDYTRKLESRYTFTLIMKHLRYYKNGWEFKVYRVGRAQIIHVGPLVMRTDVPVAVSSKFALERADAVASAVEADPVADPNEMMGDLMEEVKKIETTDPDSRFKEVLEKNWVVVDADRFKEVEFEVTVNVEPRPLYDDY